MYLRKWEPVLNKAESEIFIEATLECHICAAKFKNWKTKIHKIKKGARITGELKEIMNELFNELTERIDCSKCGTTSVVPKDEKERLRIDIASLKKDIAKNLGP